MYMNMMNELHLDPVKFNLDQSTNISVVNLYTISNTNVKSKLLLCRFP